MPRKYCNKIRLHHRNLDFCDNTYFPEKRAVKEFPATFLEALIKISTQHDFLTFNGYLHPKPR